MVSPLSPGVSTSPPYNIGLVGEAQKVNLFANPAPKVARAVSSPQLVRVVCDKLRLSSYVRITPDEFADTVHDARSSRVGKSRRGVPRAQVWTKPPKVEGGIYYQLDLPPYLPSGRGLAVAEFNPQKLGDEGWASLGVTLRAWGVEDPGRLYVERYDAAFDYLEPRHHVMLDDPARLLDMFGIGRRGPQTERTGYRSGSKLRAQVYDKSAERMRVGDKCVANLTRFELAVSSPPPLDAPAPLYDHKPGDALILADLPGIAYPAPNITVRACAYNPLRVANHVYGSLAAYARALGVRAATGYARSVFGLTHSQRLQWLDTLLPEFGNAPRAVWSERWPSAASRAVQQVSESIACPVASV